MNDDDVLGELKRLREEMVSALLTRSENYGLFKEFMALKAEVKQMKENQETQKKALEDQKNAHESVCKDLEKQKNEVEKLKVDQEKQKLETMQMKEAHEKALEDQKAEYNKVCDELAELKIKQSEDVTEIREETAEIKEKQEDHELKLQTHDDSISICKKMPVEDLIVGKWKMASSTGCEEYEKLTLEDDSYSGDRAKITFENRYFAYDGALKSYVDDNTKDPSFKSDYYIRNRKVTYSQESNHSITSYRWVHIYIEEQQLVVAATIFKDSKAAATCKCFYDRDE